MFGFHEFKRERIEAIGGSHGQVGDLVVCDQKVGAFASFEWPAFFTITEVHGEQGWYLYTLKHHGTDETLGPIAGDYLYKAGEYFRVRAEFNVHTERVLLRREKDKQIRVEVLSEVLASRGIVTVITEDEQTKLRALVELEEAKKTRG